MRDHSSEVCYVTDMHLHPEVLFSAIFAGTLVSLDTLTEALVVRGSTLFTFKNLLLQRMALYRLYLPNF